MIKLPTLLAGALLLTAPAFAHEEKAKDHAGKSHGGHHAMPEKASETSPKKAPKSFAKRPAEGTWATCPVSGEVFKVTADTKTYTHAGRHYAVCCEDCGPDFEKNPDKYADKAGKAARPAKAAQKKG